MLEKNLVVLWRSIRERLSPADFQKIISLFVDFKHGRINKSQTIESALLLLEKDKYAHRRFAEWLHRTNNSQGEQEDEDEGNLFEVRVEVAENPRGDSLRGRDQEDEDGETRNGAVLNNLLRDPKTHEDEPNLFEVRIEVDENPRGDPLRGGRKIEDEANHLEIRVKVNENPKEDSFFAKMDLEKKKRKRASRLLEQATPSYRLVTEEEQSPDSVVVLDKKLYSLKKLNDASGRKKLTDDYEEAMARCEDDMYEADMWMEALRSAVESAENVTRREMRLEDVGVKFYRCIGQLYRRDMAETVREYRQHALTVILDRLKQKLKELELARESWKLQWKKVFEENTAKQ